MFRTDIVDGLHYPKTFPAENIHLMRDITLRPNDVILSSYPKSGTNWVAYIVWRILHPDEPAPQSQRVWLDVPFVELLGLGSWKESPSDQGRTLISHLPSDRVKKDKFTKYIAIVRNPLDVCVSFYHFLTGLHREEKNLNDTEEEEILSFDDFFEQFMNGEVAFGEYFSHIKSWYDFRKEENVHLLVYEKLKANPKKEILRLAQFLGHERELEANDCQLLDKIVEESTFSAMKKNMQYSNPTTKSAIPILRTGTSGGYKNTLSPCQIATLKEKMETELSGTELLEFWRNV